eukprot:15033990-Alexandrium_andersonii.AAC.1
MVPLLLPGAPCPRNRAHAAPRLLRAGRDPGWQEHHRTREAFRANADMPDGSSVGLTASGAAPRCDVAG